MHGSVPEAPAYYVLENANNEHFFTPYREWNTVSTPISRMHFISVLSTFIFWDATFETGNYMELTRVDDFYIKGFPVS